jgi:hypothetical protein
LTVEADRAGEVPGRRRGIGRKARKPLGELAGARARELANEGAHPHARAAGSAYQRGPKGAARATDRAEPLSGSGGAWGEELRSKDVDDEVATARWGETLHPVQPAPAARRRWGRRFLPRSHREVAGPRAVKRFRQRRARAAWTPPLPAQAKPAGPRRRPASPKELEHAADQLTLDAARPPVAERAEAGYFREPLTNP